MATKASALCGALPSTPCCGCCSCAPRSGTEVFALGWSRIPLGHRSSCTRPPSWLVLHSPSCLCCLPGRPLFPCLLACALVLFGLASRFVVRCPCWCLWLLLSWFWFFCWRGLFFVWFGLFGAPLCCLSLAGFSVLLFAFVGFASRHTGQVNSYFAFTCTTKALIYHCTCVSVRRLDRFTCTVDFHRLTTS